MEDAVTAVGIVGAGLLGRLVALELVRAGTSVTVVDRDDGSAQGSCSWVGAGMLSPYSELEKAEPLIAHMGLEGMRRWRELLPTLPHPVFFRDNGSLIVAHRQDAGDLDAFDRQVSARLEYDQVVRRVDRTGIVELEPELGERFHRGIYFADEGQIEARDVLPALGMALDAAGVALIEQTAVLAAKPGRIICADGRILKFDVVVDCRGLDARLDWPALRGVRGELIRVHAPEVRLRRPVRLMHPRYPLYIVPRAEDTYLIGATQLESDDMRPVTVKSALELLSAAYSLHPGFAEAHILESAVQCRPALPNNLPSLQVEPGLMRANGLYRHGYLIGPTVAAEVASAVLGRPHTYPQLIEERHARADG